MLEDLTIPSIPVEAASGGNSKTGEEQTGGSVLAGEHSCHGKRICLNSREHLLV